MAAQLTSFTATELAVPQDVLAEMRRKSAEVEFSNFRDRVMEYFPDATSIDVYLLADPDEVDRNWIVFQVRFSKTEMDELHRRKNEFIESLVEGRPHIAWPICSLSIRFD